MTEPRTEAGRELLRWFAERFGDPVRQEATAAVTGMARDLILAIEAEAAALERALDEFGPVTFGPGCAAYDHPVDCQCPYPLARAERDRIAAIEATSWGPANIARTDAATYVSLKPDA